MQLSTRPRQFVYKTWARASRRVHRIRAGFFLLYQALAMAFTWRTRTNAPGDQRARLLCSTRRRRRRFIAHCRKIVIQTPLACQTRLNGLNLVLMEPLPGVFYYHGAHEAREVEKSKSRQSVIESAALLVYFPPRPSRSFASSLSSLPGFLCF
jgi:hypothetical protein